QALGQVVSGGWRQIALGKKLGVPQALGLTVREWVETRLGGYVRMSIEERKQAVLELAEEGHSQREIGEVLGVSEATVNRDLKPVTSVTPRADHSPVTSADANALEAGVTDVTPMPVGQEHADAILADIDQQVAEQAEAARDTELQLTLVESDPAPDDVTLPEQVNVAVVLPTPRAQVNEGDE